ncbi:hypothetical protein AMS68_004699 [Peltaster fructicola]|uniref:Rab-GAP TBC domain-containing protein n=1 Tax=Peltaster fructicola TaxID=286661 RepID=A0A6H0XWN2_9PEZI|nr:hypothetical protein AMS68_004699 [Peltaster fructicola]
MGDTGVIDQTGAVELVKRLATALAERDAHITALQRLCEEYNVPRDRMNDASSRVKQAEQRRISLANATAEDNQTLRISMSESNLRPQALRRSNSAYSTNGLTKLFGGVGRNRLSVHSESASLRSSSRASRPSEHLQRNPSNDAKSVDGRSMDAPSTDSGRWLPSMFSTAASAIKPRRESKPSRVPVELQAQIDPDQLPPTLLKNPTDPQDIEWNRFILKLMRAREQAGEQEEEGALIGAARFGREGSLGRSKMETLAKLVVGGIPNRLRHRVWMELSNAHAISQPDAYQHYLQLGNHQAHIDIDAIKKDVPRTLTQQYDYYVEKGYEKLKNLLIAFISKYEDLGYTQGLNMIAGHLLLAIPAEEDAFWMLCNIVDNFFPQEYFSRSSNLVGPLADNMVLRSYIRDIMPKLHDHLDALGILPQNTLKLGWILTAFSDMLPKEPLQRVWDVWLCLPKQHTFLFNVAMALVKQHLQELLALESEEEYYAFQFQIPQTQQEVDELIRLAVSLRKRLDPEQVTERRKLEMRRLRYPSTEALYCPD